MILWRLEWVQRSLKFSFIAILYLHGLSLNIQSNTFNNLHHWQCTVYGPQSCTRDCGESQYHHQPNYSLQAPGTQLVVKPWRYHQILVLLPGATARYTYFYIVHDTLCKHSSVSLSISPLVRQHNLSIRHRNYYNTCTAAVSLPVAAVHVPGTRTCTCTCTCTCTWGDASTRYGTCTICGSLPGARYFVLT